MVQVGVCLVFGKKPSIGICTPRYLLILVLDVELPDG